MGISGAGKWYGPSCIPPEVRVVENRYVISNPTMIATFGHVFKYCKARDIKQIITIDLWQPSGYYRPSETQLRQIIRGLKNSLLTDGIPDTLACFQLDNEPAKHRVDPNLYCWYANIIHSELGGAYDLYIGSDEVSYRDWFNYVCAHCNYDGIAFHLQNCALTLQDTDSSIGFVVRLAAQYIKKLICSEANYQNPQYPSTWINIQHQVKRCKEIGADYCVIFLELENQSKYQWLSFKYNGVIRSPYYQDYIKLCMGNRETFTMYGFELNYAKRGRKNEETRAVQQVLIDESYDLGIWGADGVFGEVTEKAVKKWQQDNSLKVDGVVGKETWQFIMANFDTGTMRFCQLLARIATYK